MTGQDYEKILQYYFDVNKVIHITCNNERFYNGTILEINVDKRLLVFIDNKLGEIPILFEEIKFVQPFMEEGE